MLCRVLKKYSLLAGTMVPAMMGVSAYAQTLTDTNGALQGLSQLSPQDLDGIRGGFNLTPELSVNFAFQQIATIDGIVVQSILVPMTTLTSSSGTPQVIVSAIVPTPASTVNTSSDVNADVTTPTPTVTTPTTGSSNDAPAATVTTTSNAGINLTTSANDGMTVVSTNLGQNGLSNVVSNQANNAIVSIESTMNIGITGMSAWLTHQQTASGLASSFYYANGGFK